MGIPGRPQPLPILPGSEGTSAARAVGHDVEGVLCPCPPGQLKLLQGLLEPKQLWQLRVNSQARSSTCRLWTSAFQTGGFGKEKARAQAGRFKALSDLFFRADVSTSSPDNFQRPASSWSETNGPQLPDGPIARSWRADKLWAVRQKAYLVIHEVQSFTLFSRSQGSSLRHFDFPPFFSPGRYRDDGLSVLVPAAAVRQAPSRAAAQTSGQAHLFITACSPGSGGKNNPNLKPFPSKLEPNPQSPASLQRDQQSAPQHISFPRSAGLLVGLLGEPRSIFLEWNHYLLLPSQAPVGFLSSVCKPSCKPRYKQRTSSPGCGWPSGLLSA